MASHRRVGRPAPPAVSRGASAKATAHSGGESSRMASTTAEPLLHRRARSSRSDGDFNGPLLLAGDEFGHRQHGHPGRGPAPTRASLPTLLPGPDRLREQQLRAEPHTDRRGDDNRDDEHPERSRHPQLANDQHHLELHHQHPTHSQHHHQNSDDRDSATGGGGGKLTRRELRDLMRQRNAAARFRKSIRSVILMVSWIKVLLKRKDYTEDESVRVVDTLKGFSTEGSDLTFDLSYFRAKREIDLTGEMKAILQLEPQLRTPEQVQTVMYGLQNLPTFNEYPLRAQEKLARVAFYQSVPAGRLIIRQGHIGINFYIIIRGRVIVSVMKEDRRTGETRTNIVARLGQGQSFGEVALLRQVARTASVVSQEPAQLLVIGREEFNEIFTKAEPGRLLPDHVEFLAGCGFMRSFPVQRLLDQPSACLLTFYRRNALIAPDSKTHSHLVVVRSGSCRVVKNLRVPPVPAGATEEEEEKKRGPPWEATGSGGIEAKVDTGLRRPQTFAARQRHQFELQLKLIDGARRVGRAAAAVGIMRFPPLLPHQLQPQSGPAADFSQKSVAAAAAAAHSRSTAALTVSVQVSTLKPGDVFGLSEVVFRGERNPEIEASASVALVSNGAECVLLSRAFFVQNASEQVRRDVRELARPYPEESVFEDNYRCQVTWDRYRRRLFRETMRLIAARNS